MSLNQQIRGGGAIVIWFTTGYEKEPLSQLNEKKNTMNTYQPTPAQSSQIKPQKSLNMSKNSTNLET